ncbi:MAG: DNA polymerase III subunit beta family protein [Candidatus Binatia bacterium]
MKQVINLANTNKRASIPILGDVLIKKGVAQATDLDIWLQHPVNCDHDPTPKKRERKTADGVYSAKLLKVGIARKALPMEDFPDVADRKDAHIGSGKFIERVVLEEDDLEGLAWVAKAVSTEETRYYLNGVAFQSGRLVATDGHRLHIYKSPNHLPKKQSFIVPKKAIKFLFACVKETKAQQVLAWFFEGFATFYIGEYTLTTKLIDGTFPDVNKVIPKKMETDRKTKFDPDDVRRALPVLEALSAFHGLPPRKRGAWGARIPVVFRDGKLWHSREKDMPFDTITEISGPIGFNVEYLLDMCAGKVRYAAAGQNNPVVVEAGKKFGIIMPMRV